jgi:bifunctional protein rfaE, domain II
MLIPNERIAEFAAALREGGARVVFTNGCFDILHAGHVRYLTAARALGDVLILGLNSDASVRRLKGETRPVNSETDRAEVVGALASVDYVVIFGEDTAEELIAKVQPAVYAKGGDYTRETLPEARIVEGYGGEVAFIPLVEGKSTTGMIAKMGRK